jgi:hypothetical protein
MEQKKYSEPDRNPDPVGGWRLAAGGSYLSAFICVHLRLRITPGCSG